MLRFQIALAIILVGCIALLSCGRDPGMLDTVTDDTTMDTTMDMTTEMMAAHKSWASVTYPAPMMTVEEAAAAMNPGGTGQAHGMGSRTIYFNEAGAMANRAGTAYPAGTMIVKEVMDATETFIMHVATMMKSDDPMYAAHNGWVYGVTQRASETEELMMPHTLNVEMAQGCHDCHVKASKIIMKPTDSVFVSLPMMDDTTMDDTTMDDTTMDDTTMDDTTMDDTTDDTTMDDTTMDDTTMDDTTMDDTTMDDTTMDDTTDDTTGNGDGNGDGGTQ